MRITCPACNAEMSLDVLFAREADAQALAGLLERHLPMGDVLLRYIALFRPAKRRLSLARVVTLLDELVPDIERGAIARKGRDWPCSQAIWRAGIEAVLAKRDKGTMTLPLVSHGLLYEVMSSLADKAEAALEANAEAERKQRRSYGAGEQLVPAAAAAQNVLSPTAPAAPVPDYSRPSRAALALKAQMQAKLQSKQTPPTPEAETP